MIKGDCVAKKVFDVIVKRLGLINYKLYMGWLRYKYILRIIIFVYVIFLN